MLKKSLLTLTIWLFQTTALSAVQLPRPNLNGDYLRNSHKSWVVVDPDPQGVNCRWSKTMPDNWYHPEAKLPPATFGQWETIRRFKKNAKLTAHLSPAGFVILYDTVRKPWLKVSLGANEKVCLVRANAKFIRPLP